MPSATRKRWAQSDHGEEAKRHEGFASVGLLRLHRDRPVVAMSSSSPGSGAILAGSPRLHAFDHRRGREHNPAWAVGARQRPTGGRWKPRDVFIRNIIAWEQLCSVLGWVQFAAALAVDDRRELPARLLPSRSHPAPEG